MSRRFVWIVGLIPPAVSTINIFKGWIIDSGAANFWRDGWHVLYVVSFVCLMMVVGDTIRVWINSRFAATNKTVQDFHKELSAAIGGLNSQFDTRLSTVNQTLKAEISALTQRVENYRKDASTQLVAEQQARIQVGVDLSQRVEKLENQKSTSSASAGAQS